MKFKFASALILPALFLAACEEEVDQTITAESGDEAAGEVLGGTISDDMIALEELTSTSPPAESSGAETGSGAGGGGSDAPGPAETTEAEAPEEAPAPEPAEE